MTLANVYSFSSVLLFFTSSNLSFELYSIATTLICRLMINIRDPKLMNDYEEGYLPTSQNNPVPVTDETTAPITTVFPECPTVFGRSTHPHPEHSWAAWQAEHADDGTASIALYDLDG